MKRLFTYFLAILAGLVNVYASSGWVGNHTYTLEDSVLTIDGPSYGTPSFNNPSEAPWYAERESIKQVVFKQDIPEIGRCFLKGLTNLTSVKFAGAGLKVIGASAFNGCTKLKSIDLPNGLTTISGAAFLGCTGLTSFVIPDGVEVVENSILEGCTSLRSVTVGKGVKRFYMNASMAFYGCTSLDTIVWNATFCENCFTVQTSPFHDERTNSFDIRSHIKSITFGDNVQYIPDYLCAGLTEITSVEIPQQVGRVPDNYLGFQLSEHTFEGCTGLKTVTIASTPLLLSVSPGYFNMPICFGSQVENYIVADCVDSIAPYAFANATELRSVTLGKNLIYAGEGVFSGCPKLNTIVWRCANYTGSTNPLDGIRSQITSLVFEEGVEHIPAYGFMYLENIGPLTFPEGLKTIGANAFTGSLGVTAINVPASLEKVENTPFETLHRIDLASLTTWCQLEGGYNLTNHLYDVGGEPEEGGEPTEGGEEPTEGDDDELPKNYGLFYNGEWITDLVIPEDVEVIRAYAFSGVPSLRSVIIPDNVESIEEHAFSGCDILDSVSIGSGINHLAEKAFTGCVKTVYINAAVPFVYPAMTGTMDHIFDTNVKKYVLGNNVTFLGQSAFKNCTGMEEIVLPPTLTAIAEDVFWNCSSLTSIDIPASVDTIGEYAFYNCQKLTSVINRALTPQIITTEVFYGVDVTEITLYVPKQSIALYQKAEVWKDFNQILPLQDTEGMEEIIQHPTANSQKLIKNGQLFILRGDKVYTLHGQEVR